MQTVASHKALAISGYSPADEVTVDPADEDTVDHAYQHFA